MVQFSLKVRGTLDDSSSQKITKDKLNNILPKLLETDAGLSAEPTTMNKYIQSIKTLSVSSCNKQGNQFCVGAWVFVLKKDKWKFVQAFIEK